MTCKIKHTSCQSSFHQENSWPYQKKWATGKFPPPPSHPLPQSSSPAHYSAGFPWRQVLLIVNRKNALPFMTLWKYIIKRVTPPKVWKAAQEIHQEKSSPSSSPKISTYFIPIFFPLFFCYGEFLIQIFCFQSTLFSVDITFALSHEDITHLNLFAPNRLIVTMHCGRLLNA